MTRRAVRIGGFTIAIESDEAFELLEATARFIVPADAPADVVIRSVRGVPHPPNGNLIFDSGETWQLYRDGNRNVFTFRSPLCKRDPCKTASFNETFSEGDVVLGDDLELGIDPIMFPLDELLIGVLLGHGEGVELHGCGMIVDGRGYLFVGQSGAGKTTTARLWLEHAQPNILSDDRIIVREMNGALRMYGTPWHGEANICAADDAELAGIFLLTQSETTELRLLAPGAAMARLFACSFPLFYRAESVARSLAFLGTIINRGIVHELAFRPDVSAVRVVSDHSNWS